MSRELILQPHAPAASQVEKARVLPRPSGRRGRRVWVTRTPTGLLDTDSLKLVSSFLEWAGFAPRGHLAMSRDILIVITGGRVLLASAGEKAGL